MDVDVDVDVVRLHGLVPGGVKPCRSEQPSPVDGDDPLFSHHRCRRYHLCIPLHTQHTYSHANCPSEGCVCSYEDSAFPSHDDDYMYAQAARPGTICMYRCLCLHEAARLAADQKSTLALLHPPGKWKHYRFTEELNLDSGDSICIAFQTIRELPPSQSAGPTSARVSVSGNVRRKSSRKRRRCPSQDWADLGDHFPTAVEMRRPDYCWHTHTHTAHKAHREEARAFVPEP